MNLLINNPLVTYLQNDHILKNIQIYYDQAAKNHMGKYKFIVDFPDHKTQKGVMKKYPEMKKYIKQWNRVRLHFLILLIYL